MFVNYLLIECQSQIISSLKNLKVYLSHHSLFIIVWCIHVDIYCLVYFTLMGLRMLSYDFLSFKIMAPCVVFRADQSVFQTTEQENPSNETVKARKITLQSNCCLLISTLHTYIYSLGRCFYPKRLTLCFSAVANLKVAHGKQSL